MQSSAPLPSESSPGKAHGGRQAHKKWRCPDHGCAIDLLHVERSQVAGVWRVQIPGHDTVWLVAMSAPACPNCGTTLVGSQAGDADAANH